MNQRNKLTQGEVGPRGRSKNDKVGQHCRRWPELESKTDTCVKGDRVKLSAVSDNHQRTALIQQSNVHRNGLRPVTDSCVSDVKDLKRVAGCTGKHDSRHLHSSRSTLRCLTTRTSNSATNLRDIMDSIESIKTQLKVAVSATNSGAAFQDTSESHNHYKSQFVRKGIQNKPESSNRDSTCQLPTPVFKERLTSKSCWEEKVNSKHFISHSSVHGNSKAASDTMLQNGANQTKDASMLLCPANTGKLDSGKRNDSGYFSTVGMSELSAARCAECMKNSVANVNSNQKDLSEMNTNDNVPVLADEIDCVRLSVNENNEDDLKSVSAEISPGTDFSESEHCWHCCKSGELSSDRIVGKMTVVGESVPMRCATSLFDLHKVFDDASATINQLSSIQDCHEFATSGRVMDKRYSQSSVDVRNDVSCWLSLHRQKLREQKYTSIEPCSGGGYSNFSSSLTYQRGGTDSLPLDLILNMADDIIGEKDRLIEKQRLKIMQLEKILMGSRVPTMMKRHVEGEESKGAQVERLQQVEGCSEISKHSPHLELLDGGIKLKSQQREMKTSFDKLDETIINKSGHDLEELLGQRDADVKSLRREIFALKEELSTSKKVIEMWTDRVTGMTLDNEKLRQQSSHQCVTEDQQIQELNNEIIVSREENCELNKRLIEHEGQWLELNMELQCGENTVTALKTKITACQEEASCLRVENEELKRVLVEQSHKFKSEINREQAAHSDSALISENNKLKKLLESRQRQLQQLVDKCTRVEQQLSDELRAEQEAKLMLQVQLADKDQQLRRLRQSLRDLSLQNQELLEKRLAQQEALRVPAEIEELQRRLEKEMQFCVSELRNVVHFCVQVANEKQPDLSVLLGIKKTVEDNDRMESKQLCDGDGGECAMLNKMSVETLRSYASSLSKIRKDLDAMRDLLATRFAEELGSTITCAMQ